MNTASSTRYGLAACGGGGGDGNGQPAVPGGTPTAGNPPQQPGGDQPATPALKCAP